MTTEQLARCFDALQYDLQLLRERVTLLEAGKPAPAAPKYTPAIENTPLVAVATPKPPTAPESIPELNLSAGICCGERYGVTSILHKIAVASRLILCCDTGKPYDYHSEAGEFMIASHKTPIICRYRSCLNPEHLFWDTLSGGCQRREAEEAARKLASELASELTEGTTKHC